MKNSTLILLMVMAAMLAMAAGAGLYAADKPKAESFKSSEFISWQRDNQEYFIRISIGMAVLIADQNDKAQAACLSDWFGKDEAAAYNRILETMKRFPDYHPRGVILAVAEKQCGPFIYTGR